MSKDKTTSEKLMEIVNELHLFGDSSDKGWARVNGHCYPVKSSQFESWLQWKYYDFHKKVPPNKAIQKVLKQAASKTLYGDSVPENVNVRVSKESETIIVDRASEYGTNKVEVTGVGWQEGASKISNFWRPKGMNPLPRPAKGGTIQDLRKFLNVKSDSYFRLLVAWLLTAYNPEVACPILVLQGEQGSAKSTTARMLRSLIDPNGAPIRSAPKDEREMIIQAQNSRVLCLDNLSGLKKWLSDTLCRICSGTGFSTRRLYTNDEEEIYKVKRPIILNGIDDIATRGDLLDRSIVLNLPAISSDERRDERQLWDEFKQKQPYILGALYSALSAGLAAAKPKLKELPRSLSGFMNLTCRHFFLQETCQS